MVNRMQFLQTHGKSLQANRKALKHGPKSFEKKITFVEEKLSNSTLFWMPPEKRVYMTPAITFVRKSKKFRTISENEKKNVSFQLFTFAQNVAMDS